ncbi:ABC transporter permease [Alkaliphilus sp. B6464]|uniref:ABC transporter permease n=1 Tax=Alkaliphilus sp. B6464 TaxID=2731219 RepID=UPI001BA8EABE|nr:ABC transporter permease [Alkaliphilus sp. B6464]QUH19120.1 ABC transporter permease [Alkaliphilus sp. B6464]
MLLNLIGKDIKRALRNRKSLLILLVMPAVLITILGFSIGRLLDNEDGWMAHSTIGIVNLDNAQEGREKIINTISQLAGEEESFDIEEIKENMKSFDFEKILLEDIFGSEALSKFLSYEILGEEEALNLLEKEELSAVIIIPEDFTYYTMMNLASPFIYRQQVQVLKSKNNSFTGNIVEEIMTGFTNVLSSGIIAKSSLFEIGAEMGIGDKLQTEIGTLLEGVLSQSSTIKLQMENRNAVKSVNGMQYYSVGIAMMFVLYVAGYGAKYAFDEKYYHTYERLRISNVTKGQILMSRGITTFLIAFMQIVILIIYSSLIFSISWGEPLNVLTLTISVALAVGGISAFLTAINYKIGNTKISNMFENVIIMIFASLGGSFFPIKGAPLLGKMGSLTPNGTAINGYIKLMQGYGIGEIVGSLTVLISIFIGSLVLAVIILKQGEVA